MLTDKKWELTILEADVPAMELDCLATGDVDGDGNIEIIAGGKSSDCALAWYRPATCEKGTIFKSGFFHVGLALEDIDGDGLLEVITGVERVQAPNTWEIVWFKPAEGPESAVDAICHRSLV